MLEHLSINLGGKPSKHLRLTAYRKGCVASRGSKNIIEKKFKGGHIAKYGW